MKLCSSSTTLTGTKPTLSSALDRAHADIAARRDTSAPSAARASPAPAPAACDLGRDAVGDRAVGIGQFDLDPIGARRLARGLGDEADSCRSRVSPVTSRTSAVSPTLMPASLRSATSTTASIGSSATICAISLPGERERRLPDLDRHIGDDALPRRAHDAAVALGLGRRERRLRGLELRLEVDELEPRQRSPHDQRAAWPRARSRFWVTSALACATCASRASSDSTAMTSSFLTHRAALAPAARSARRRCAP